MSKIREKVLSIPSTFERVITSVSFAQKRSSVFHLYGLCGEPEATGQLYAGVGTHASTRRWTLLPRHELRGFV